MKIASVLTAVLVLFTALSVAVAEEGHFCTGLLCKNMHDYKPCMPCGVIVCRQGGFHVYTSSREN